MILKKGERLCSLKACCQDVVCCSYYRALALNDDDLFPLLWISFLTVPIPLTFIIWVYTDSCPEAPNGFLVAEVACRILSASCSRWLTCCNRLSARYTGPLPKMSQPPYYHHWLSQQMHMWMSRSFHLWIF